MPTYVYGCDTCGHKFEKFQSFQDTPLRECPECGASIRRIFQPAGIIFKGSGWYSKDSRGGSTGGATESAGEADGGAESKKNGDQPSSAAPKEGAAKDTTESNSPGPAKAAD